MGIAISLLSASSKSVFIALDYLNPIECWFFFLNMISCFQKKIKNVQIHYMIMWWFFSVRQKKKKKKEKMHLNIVTKRG